MHKRKKVDQDATERAALAVSEDMKTKTRSYTRRTILFCVAALPLSATAHPGHGQSHIVADATAISVKGDTVTVSLTIFNGGKSDVTLFEVFAAGAISSPIKQGLLAAGSMRKISFDMKFHEPVPTVFTATLDFGDDGQAPVNVTV